MSDSAPDAPRQSGRPPILIPLAVLIVATGLIRMLDLDLKTAAAFYGADPKWPWNSNPIIQLLYRYGTYPAIITGSVAGVLWIVSAFRPEMVRNRAFVMFLALSMAIGPGLLVNGLFKEFYGRPRPDQVEQFQGDREFLPVWEPNFSQKAKSFPSGHASMGFYFLCPGIFYWERRRALAWVFLGFGLVYGSMMGFGRIAQGGHWLSDVLWAAGMVYLSAWILYRTLRLSPAYSPAQSASDATQS